MLQSRVVYRRLFAVSCTILACSPHSYLSADESGPRVSISPRKSQTIPTGGRVSPLVRANVRVVLVPVSVTDALNRPIRDLSKEQFRILEDGVEQKITSFAWEDGPVSIGLLFDTSGSMKNRMDASVSALKHIVQTSIPGDEFFLAQFSDDVRLLNSFTSEAEGIQQRLGHVQASGWTALLDAVALGIHEMKSARNGRKVLVILSDGNDNNSRFTASEIRNRVMESDVRIFAIALSYRPRLLQRLAEDTGGSVLVAHDISELPDVAERLNVEIRSQYLLGYTPSNVARDGKFRKIKVELLQPAGASSLRASWRRGYYADGWAE